MIKEEVLRENMTNNRQEVMTVQGGVNKSFILFGVLLMMGIRFYKKARAKKSWDKFEKGLIDENKKIEK